MSHIDRALQTQFRDADRQLIAKAAAPAPPSSGSGRMPPPPPLGPRVMEPTDSSDWLDLRDVVGVLVRRRWQILTVMICVLAPAVLYTVFAQRTYFSVAIVQVDPEPVQVLPYREIDQPANAPNYEVFMRSQEQILRSSALLGRVAKRLESEEPAVRSESGYLTSRFSLQRLETTQLFRLGYVSPDPSVAARVANLFAEEWVTLNFDMRQDKRQKAKELLERELKGLEAKMQVSEDTLVRYAQANGLSKDEKFGGVPQQRLMALGNQVNDADAQVNTARSKLDALTNASVEEFPEKLTTPAIASLETRLLELEQQLTSLRASFGENWPLVVQKRSEVALVNDQINREKMSALARAREQAELDVASAENRRNRENSSLSDQQRLVHQIEEASIKYNIIRREVDTNQKLYDGMLERLKQTSVTAGMEFGGFHIVEPAVPSPLPDNPKTGFILALSAILGLALGMCVAIGRHYWEASLMTVEEVERLTMLPVLGSIPLMSGGGGRRLLDAGRKLLPGNKADSLVRVVPLMPDGVTAPNLIEGVETICASLLLSQSGRPPRVLLVTSSVAGEGKTTVACQIARTFAQGGAKTLLVDCDLRRPQLDKVLGIGNDAGLALYLSGHMGPKPTVHMTEQENLFCVVAGPRAPNPPALLGSENMADFLRLMADTHQFVVIDSAPILPVADARVLARAVDGVILVVRAGAAPSPIVKRVTSILESVQAPLLGFVLNGAESLGFRSQYSRYYGD